MAKVSIEKNGQRGNIDADKLDAAIAKGWKRVVVGGGEGEEGESDSPSTAGETAEDSIRAGTRGVTFGLNDVAAGVGAAAGDAFQAVADGRDRNPNAYAEGRDLERAGDEAARQRSPTASGRAELGGALLTAPLFAAKGAQAARGGSSVMGLAPEATTALQRAAPTAARLAKGAGAGLLGAFGFGDVDELDAESAGQLSAGAGAGVLGELLGPQLPGLIAATPGAIRAAPGAALSAGRALATKLKPAASKAGGAIDAVADMVPEALLPGAVRKTSAALKQAGTPTADTAPVGELADDELRQILDELSMPDAPAPARKVPDNLPDEPLPRPDPRTPASQLPKPRAAPATDATGRSTTAVPLSDADMAALMGEVSNGLQSRQLAEVQRRMATQQSRAPAPTTDPLDDIIGRTRRQQSAAPDTNPVAIDDAMGRSPKAVASVKQQELWRKTYDALPANKRQEYLAQIKTETGLPDDTIRQRLKLTKAEWARKSFNR